MSILVTTPRLELAHEAPRLGVFRHGVEFGPPRVLHRGGYESHGVETEQGVSGDAEQCPGGRIRIDHP